jgi:hypothetical protein
LEFPDLKDSLGMLLEGVFSSQNVDGSGEIVRTDGIDISIFEERRGVANWEHIKPEIGLGKEVVGRVVYVKKIFNEKDCTTKSQKFFFQETKRAPYLYGIVRLFDAAGHHEAQDLAAQIRDYDAHKEKSIVRFSIEGQGGSKCNGVVETSIARRVALTLAPANSAAVSRLLFDPNAPTGYEEVDRLALAKGEMMKDPAASLGKAEGAGRILEKSEALEEEGYELDDQAVVHVVLLSNLLKALTAGSGDCAPSALTGGAALVKEDIQKQVQPASVPKETEDKYRGTVLKALATFDRKWDRESFKKHLASELADAKLDPVSPEFLDHFASIAERSSLKKSEDEQTAMALLSDAMRLDVQFAVALRDIGT